MQWLGFGQSFGAMRGGALGAELTHGEWQNKTE